MKKFSFKKWLPIIAVIFLVIAAFESYIHYVAYKENPLFRLVLTFQNSIKAFLFSPSISAETALKELKATTNVFEKYIGIAYIVTVFLAPFCTASAIAIVVERFLRNQQRVLRVLRHDAQLIFGYNDSVKMLLKKHGKGKSIIHIVSAQPISEKEELALMKRKIYYRQLDCVYASDNEIRSYLSGIRAKKIDRIFILEDSSMRNVSLYMRLCELAADSSPFAADALCRCRCTENYARELVGDYFDSNKPSLGLYLFDLAELRVSAAFEQHPLWDNSPDLAPTLPAENFDRHILIAGFGRTGEQMLRQVINIATAHSGSTVLIDIVDKDAVSKKNIFFSSLDLDEAFTDTNTLTIGENFKRASGERYADGTLVIRFHSIDARARDFSQLLRRISAEMPLSYAAVCIKDMDVGIRCVAAIERCAANSCAKPFPIAVGLDGSEQLADYLDDNTGTFATVFAMAGSSKNELSLDNIGSAISENTARAYHEIYRKIHFGPIGSTAKPGAAWNELQLYQQQANRLLAAHSPAKEYLLRTADSRPAAVCLRERLSAVGITADNTSFVYNFDEDELLRRIEGDSILLELMRTEHRRWCYAMLFDGYSGDCDAKPPKGDPRKLTPYIRSWDNLDKSVKKYDLLPALMMIQ